MAITYKKIESIIVASGGASSVQFLNIPADYTDLVLKCSIRTNAASTTQDRVELTINNSTSSIYDIRTMEANGSSVLSGSRSNYNLFFIGEAAGSTAASATSNTFGSMELYFTNYASGSSKAGLVDAVTENNATLAYAVFNSILWKNNSAITSLKLEPFTGSAFLEHCSFILYGIKKA